MNEDELLRVIGTLFVSQTQMQAYLKQLQGQLKLAQEDKTRLEHELETARKINQPPVDGPVQV